MSERDSFFFRGMNFVVEKMVISDWPLWLRRLFVLTFPIGFPIYLLFFFLGTLSMGFLGSILGITEYLYKLWKE